MTVIRWNPLREIDDLFARTGHFQTAGLARPRAPSSAPGFTPLADISETDSAYFIDLELPGVAAQDVRVSVHDGILSIAGERPAPHSSDLALKEAAAVDAAPAETDHEADHEETRRVYRTERNYGKFERRFRLPKDASVDAVEARAKEGVLTVSIARREETVRRAIEVKVA